MDEAPERNAFGGGAVIVDGEAVIELERTEPEEPEDELVFVDGEVLVGKESFVVTGISESISGLGWSPQRRG